MSVFGLILSEVYLLFFFFFCSSSLYKGGLEHTILRVWHRAEPNQQNCGLPPEGQSPTVHPASALWLCASAPAFLIDSSNRTAGGQIDVSLAVRHETKSQNEKRGKKKKKKVFCRFSKLNLLTL